ncbi:MAG: WecB/TagA/CpsF family glycosyltransferase [Elainellaceae cyanobacterium]
MEEKFPMHKQVNILDVPIDNLSQLELLGKLKDGGILFTPNVDHIVKLQKDPEFFKAYQSATYRTCDSQVLVYASKFLNTPICEKISGSDLFPAFYEHYADDEDITIFILGAAEGVAEQARRRINEHVGRNMVVKAYSPSYGFEQDEQECEEIIQAINASKATVLAVGVGAPKQEKWIHKYKDRFEHVKLIMAIGATIDFEARRIDRAPKWVSSLGAEWLFRLLKEPRRLWRRYLIDDLPFLWMVLQQKWGNVTHKPAHQVKLDSQRRV